LEKVLVPSVERFMALEMETYEWRVNCKHLERVKIIESLVHEKRLESR